MSYSFRQGAWDLLLCPVARTRLDISSPLITYSHATRGEISVTSIYRCERTRTDDPSVHSPIRQPLRHRVAPRVAVTVVVDECMQDLINESLQRSTCERRSYPCTHCHPSTLPVTKARAISFDLNILNTLWVGVCRVYCVES